MKTNNCPPEIGLGVVLDHIAPHCVSAYGKDGLGTITILENMDDISRRLDSIDAIISDMDSISGIEKCFVSIDTQKQKLASGVSLDVFELLYIGEFLIFSQEIKKLFSNENYANTEIRSLADDISDYGGFCRRLSEIINPDGSISSNASETLYKIRQEKNKLNKQVQEIFSKYFKNREYEEYFVEKAPVIRENRLTLAIKASYKRNVKGLLVDISDSGDTVYIEPFDVVEANNNLRELEIAEKTEIDNILRDLTATLRNSLDDIRTIADTIAKIDRLIAIAVYCSEKGMNRPAFGDTIVLYGLRNPLLDNPFPVNFKWDRNNVLIISGANTGGKTALLKSVGLSCIMAAMGLYIPAEEGSGIIHIKKLFVDIGDMQDIQEGLSSFSGHVRNLNNIVANADEESLVLMDEIGSSTDPQEGAALAIAYIEQISSRARIIATTHLLPLKTYAIEHFATGAMYHKDDKYIYEYNSISSSNAINIAKELGTDKNIIERAASLIDEKYVDIENVYRYLEEEKAKLARKSRELDDSINKSEEARNKLNAELSTIKMSKQKVIAEYRDKLKADIEEIKSSLKNKLSGKISTKDYAQAMSELNRDLEKFDDEIKPAKKEEKAAKPMPAKEKFEPVIGAKCYYHAMEKEGVLQSISDNKAVVLFGVIKMTVPISDLSPSIEESEEKKEKTKFKSDFIRVNQDLSGIGFTLDIRGYRALDGVDAVEQYLDKVSQIGYKEVTILHGKGTGQLKKAVQDYLKTSPYVKKYREGKIGEGDAGITVVEVK